MQIIPNWANIPGPLLKAGTPISAAGIIANSDAAIGILPNDVGKTDPVRPVSLIVRGILSLPDIEESFGASLTDACKAALDEIAFVKSDGTLDVASSLPDYSEASEGDVLSIDSDGEPSWALPSGGGSFVVTFGGSSGVTPDKTNAEIAAAASAGQLVVFNWTTEYGKCSALASVTVSSGTMTGAAASAIQPGLLNAEASSIKYQNGSWTLKEAYLPYPDV